MEVKDDLRAKRRIIQVVVIVFLVFVVFVIFAVPAIVSSGKVRQIIISKINSSVQGKTQFSDLSMGWFKGIQIGDLSYKDNSGWLSVKVKSISTKPNYASMLFGNINLGQTRVDTPQVEINMNEKPAQTVKAPTEAKSTSSKAPMIALATDIHINDGNVKVTGTDSRTVELEQINSNVNIKPPGEQSIFTLGMIVASDNEKSKIEAKGKVTPTKKSGWTMKDADIDAGVNIGDLDLESIEPFLEMAGINVNAKGSISIDVQSRIVAGQLENFSGTIKGSQLEIENARTKEKIETSVLDADVKLTRKEQMINIDKMQVQTDWAKIQAVGAVPTTIKSLDSFLSSQANYDLNGTFDVNVAAIVSQMPMTIGLKEGTEISSGELTGDIKTIGSAGNKQIQAQAKLSDLRGTVEGKQVSLSAPISAQAQVSPGQGGVNINNLVVSAPFAEIKASGNLKQVKFNGQADLSKLQSELSQFVDIGPYKLTGQFVEAGQVSLEEKQVNLSGSSTIKDLNITGPNNVKASMPEGQVTYVLDLDRQKNILNVNSLDAGMDFGKVTVKNGVVPLKKDSTQPLNVVVNAEQIDLSKLGPFAILFGGLPEDMKLGGTAQSQVSITSQKQVYTIQSDSTKIKDLKVAFTDRKPLERSEATAIFKIELDSEKTPGKKIFFRLNSPDINIPEANISQVQEDGKTKLTGQVELQYDWSALSTIAAPFMPEGLDLKGRQTNNINFESEYPTGQKDKLLANLEADADLGFQSADYMGLDFGPTDVKITVRNGLLNIAPFKTTVNQGEFQFGAQADFKQKPTIFKIDKPMQIVENIKINDSTTRQLLKYLNPIFANATNVSGIANFQCEKLDIPLSAAAKNDAVITGTVSMTQLRLQTSDFLAQIINLSGGNVTGTTLTIHPTRFTLKDGFLTYDDMQIDVGNNPVNFSGVIGLDKSLNMSVTLPYTIEGTTVRVGQQSGSRITLPIKGTVDKPQLDLGKLLQNQLQNELENQLRKGLEGLFGGSR
ncbi:MAG: hypothetical protein P8016_12720 [Sedimentisphaerales bacterium]